MQQQIWVKQIKVTKSKSKQNCSGDGSEGGTPDSKLLQAIWKHLHIVGWIFLKNETISYFCIIYCSIIFITSNLPFYQLYRPVSLSMLPLLYKRHHYLFSGFFHLKQKLTFFCFLQLHLDIFLKFNLLKRNWHLMLHWFSTYDIFIQPLCRLCVLTTSEAPFCHLTAL